MRRLFEFWVGCGRFARKEGIKGRMGPVESPERSGGTAEMGFEQIHTYAYIPRESRAQISYHSKPKKKTALN